MKNNKNTILIAFICSLFVCTLMTQEVSGKMPEYTRDHQTNTIVRAELTPGELENCRAPGQLGATAAYHYSVDDKCKADVYKRQMPYRTLSARLWKNTGRFASLNF